ncbi:hypothetical protein B0H14DRAFT_2597254 [Mycena olivaceomarginata]|nr:hypothetical protein B0H14DRAFT_2597254 [Mycena olivaceomarginata]
MLSHTLLPIAGAILSYVLYYVYCASIYALRNVPGPRSPSFIFGNFKQIQIRHLHVSDINALGHILANGSAYQRPTSMNESRKNFLGNGILNAEDDDHRRQASTAHPIFEFRIYCGADAETNSCKWSIPGLVTEIFVQKSIQLRDIWASRLAQENSSSTRVDVFSWLRRMTLDVIGQAGYQLFEFTEAIFPLLKRLGNALSVAGRIVSDSIRASDGEKSFDSKKDLLSVLLRANLAKNVPESQRMRDDEVVRHKWTNHCSFRSPVGDRNGCCEEKI